MRFVLWLSLIPFPSFGDCLTDYRLNQRWQSHALTPTQIEVAARLAPAEGWRYLAHFGDPYAALAAEVVDGRWLRTYIHRHWVNTIGTAETLRLFASFARQHYGQYVEILATGTWPDADQILNSYLTAARAHGLPEFIVFDAAWTASDYSRTVSWQTLNRLPAARQVRYSGICLSIPREVANASLARDFATGL